MAWRIYLATLGWHLQQRRMRYALLFPGLAILAPFRRKRTM
jgi:hypothetical protein